jgi:hypothetical protein
MLKSTKAHIEEQQFDAYKTRIGKISDAQKKTNAAHMDVILARINPVAWSAERVKNTQNTSNLTPEEIESICENIKSSLPILGSPAIIKLFASLWFRDVSANEKDGVLILWENEYEVFKTTAKEWWNKWKEFPIIRMPNHTILWENTDMANKATTGIRWLFPDRTIKFNLESLNTSANIHGLYPGYRDPDNGKSDNVGHTVYGWTGGDDDAVIAPYVWRDHTGNSKSGYGDRRYALCLVASFG